MKRLVALALAAMFVSACGDHKPTTVAATSAPQLKVKPPAVETPPVALPPLPSVNATDATAASAPETPTPVTGAAPTAIDSPATDPKGTLSKPEEANSMPMAGHGNNHSSPSLESAPQK